MRLERELDPSHVPTGAYWYAGRRIVRCEMHPRRWTIEGTALDITGWTCGCIRTLDAAARIITDLARPADRPQPPLPSRSHLRLVVSN